MRSHKKTLQPKLDHGAAEIHIRQLASDDKIIMALYFYESLSVDEIAGVLKKAPETIQAHLEVVTEDVFRSASPVNGAARFTADVLS